MWIYQARWQRNYAENVMLVFLLSLELSCLKLILFGALQIQIASVTAAGIEVEEPYEVSTYWGYSAFQHTEYHGIKRPHETFVGR